MSLMAVFFQAAVHCICNLQGIQFKCDVSIMYIYLNKYEEVITLLEMLIQVIGVSMEVLTLLIEEKKAREGE